MTLVTAWFFISLKLVIFIWRFLICNGSKTRDILGIAEDNGKNENIGNLISKQFSKIYEMSILETLPFLIIKKAIVGPIENSGNSKFWEFWELYGPNCKKWQFFALELATLSTTYAERRLLLKLVSATVCSERSGLRL